ncbi:hypothetical protein F2Q69_00036326 [Brassica cretica]|uniref:Uncharacterized protein n=1 Tax=Brassica cretica TaxID=69181 RepID=A0A8S9SK37_BRACR|nr:hypothetical protein F2Q69_00036326 [Brassica cretica]
MVRNSSFGGLVSHIKHQLKSGILEALSQPSCDPSIHLVLHPESISNLIQSSEPILRSFKCYQSHSSGTMSSDDERNRPGNSFAGLSNLQMRALNDSMSNMLNACLDQIHQRLLQANQTHPRTGARRDHVPVEVHSSDQTRQTDQAVYRLNPRTSGLELRPGPRPDDRTDRTEARLSRPTRRAKADGQARINLGRANSDSDHSYSLLAHLARTACTGDCTDDLSSLFDPFMDFPFGYFSKARILKLSKDLGYVGTQLVRSERPVALADCPAHVLILSALNTANSDASGQEPNGHLD